jgi:hypothetical protein
MTRNLGGKTFGVKPKRLVGFQGDILSAITMGRVREALPTATEEVRAHPFGELSKTTAPFIVRCELCGHVSKRKGQLSIEGDHYVCSHPKACLERRGYGG